MPRAKDPSRLSKKPEQIRNRLRRKGKALFQDIDLYIENGGTKPLDEWDLEELARGRPRAKNGKFAGRAAQWIQPSVAMEARRRLFQHAYGGMARHLDLALETVANLMNCTDLDENGRPIVDAAVKLKAAMFIIEHIVGKPKTHIELEATDMAKQTLASALVLDDGSPAHPVVDGQFTEREDDDDE